MMRSSRFLIVFLFLLGCTDREQKEMIAFAEKMVDAYPDSVYRLLEGVDVDEISDEKDKADFALVYTEALYKSRLSTKSDSLIKIALNYYFDKDDHLKAAKSAFYMGKVYSDLDSVKIATEYLIRAESHILNEHDDKLSGLIESELGKLYLRQLMTESALKHYRKARFHFYRASDSSNENYAIGNIARCFFEIDQIDSALYYYSDAKNRAKERHDDDYLMYLDKHLIQLYVRTGETKLARDLSAGVYALDSNKYHYYYNLSDCAYSENRFDSARYYVEALLSDTLLELSLLQRVSALIRLREIEEKAGHFKEAYFWSLKCKDLSDSLYTNFRNDYIAQAEAKYGKEQLLNQNYLLQIKNYRKVVLACVLAFFLSISVFIIVCLVIRHRAMVKKDAATIHEYMALVEVLEERHIATQNDLLEKLSEKEEKERKLEVVLQKRLEIIKCLSSLLATFGNRDEGFERKIKEMLREDILTQDTLSDLLDVVNLNYYGIIDFLRRNYKLSKEGLVVCSLICSNFSRLEISIILGITVEALYTRCNRLKDDMGIDMPLIAFLEKTLARLKGNG